MGDHATSFSRRLSISRRLMLVGRVWYGLKAMWRHVRISKALTAALGPQYRRSRDMIEIDITYACNLHCLNCNRSVTQAPERSHMPLSMIISFVDDSVSQNKMWRRIRVLGGEPTLHPEFDAIVQELLRYRRWHPDCRVEVVTNGYGKSVQAKIESIPEEVWIENSRKTTIIQPSFGPFNMAPCDDPKYSHADYSNGCAIMHECGMGLTPSGYYPCAVAGGIDRITKNGLGVASLPDDSDDMHETARRLCQLCGRFRAGHFIPHNLRPPLLDEQMSPTWERLYQEWRSQKESNGRPMVEVTVQGRLHTTDVEEQQL